MAVLEKIRVKLGILITVLIAVALLSFIIDPQTLSSTAQRFSSDNKVGVLDGKSISYSDFYQEVEYFTRLTELMGQSSNSEEVQKTIRNAAWQSLLDKHLFQPMIADAGIVVGDEEMLDLTQGANISPVVANQQMFQDANGTFSREALVSFVQAIPTDATGQYEMYWHSVENSVYTDRLYNKYASLIGASNVYNKVEQQRMIFENNVLSSVDFVLSPLGFERDTAITVSNKEVKEYYKARKELFTRPATRNIEYVLYEVVPSDEDIERQTENFNALYVEFAVADNPKNFIALNSDRKWDPFYYTEEELESEPHFKAVAFGKRAPAVSEISSGENQLAAARLSDIKIMADSAKVWYAPFPLENEAEADELLARAQKMREPSEEFSEMGWITQDVLSYADLAGFEKALEPATGKAYKIKGATANAYFIVYVAERTKAQKKAQLATFVKNIIPSEDTYRDFQMKATDLADRSDGDYEKFAWIVREEQLPVIPVNGLLQTTERIGVVENARSVVHWAFDRKTKSGEVSDVISVDNKYYFVAAVTSVYKEGVIPLNEIQQDIVYTITAEKQIEKMASTIGEQIEGCTTMEQVAEALGTTVSHQDGITFGTTLQQLDPKFIGAVASAQPGVISGPVAGDIGVYVFQVIDRQTGTFYTEGDVQKALSRKSAYQTQLLQQVMSEIVEIKDNRARFF
ncbi:MAG TPA: SurA N-terminal domain-containing protein [Bacteroidales bacterium]|jgi:peptidyl-prolyl cis-trans isomerase D|nr:SurA N-terminal domain-containing protein [Bacteroidales bacterium]